MTKGLQDMERKDTEHWEGRSEHGSRKGTSNKRKISLIPSTAVSSSEAASYFTGLSQTRVHVLFDDLGRNKSIFKANLCITHWIPFRFSSALMKSYMNGLNKKELAS